MATPAYGALDRTTSLPSPFADESLADGGGTDDVFIRRLLTPATWKVLDFPETAWWGHLPFMFCVVDLMRPRRFVELGTHHGASYFSALQASQRLDVQMDSFAVDSWEGEVHTGHYTDEVYDAVISILEERGYTNATPLRMMFDEAAELFAPESIDLLHIDGLHTYEAVKHDHELWFDKVVPGGVVLFHDINVHEKDFGVWRLWREIAEPGNSFAFHHSHGLGVLQKEGSSFPQVARMLRILRDDGGTAEFVQLMIERIAELGHISSKLPPTQLAHSEQRDRLLEIQRQLERNTDWTTRLDRELAAVRKDRDKELTQAQRASEFEAAHRKLQQASTEFEANLELAAERERDADRQLRVGREKHQARRDELRRRVEGLTTKLERARTETRLARAAAAGALERASAERQHLLDALRPEPASSALPNIAQRVVRRVDRSQQPVSDHIANEATRQFRLQQLAGDLVTSGLFDEHFYLTEYPDVAGYTGSPVDHFVHHGRAELRKPNELFDPNTYLGLNSDVAAQRADPTEHYLYRGAYELRDIGDGFDTAGYVLSNREAVGEKNPLGHYLLEGRAQGLSPIALQEIQEVDVRRRHKSVDRKIDRAATERLLGLYRDVREQVDATPVSVVMPSYNRADVIEAAVRSVQGQTHHNWELIIVDDGSTDSTLELLERYTRDARISVIANDHGGVSVARNTGLHAATGDYIAYLDTDNEWTTDYLRLMLTNFAQSDSRIAYSAMVSVDDDGHVTSFLSSEFDWASCFESNYVDLNVFMHARDEAPGAVRFEPRLRRMVDWDFILAITRDEVVDHVPFIGCRYADSDAIANRISRFEPVIYRSLIQQRNAPDLAEMPTFEELAQALTLSFAIRISAPWMKRHVWGDSFYAEALKTAIEECGHAARVVYQDDGDSFSQGEPEEVNLVLRGLTPHAAIPGNINVLWVISHPELVTNEEMAGYNLVYLASASHAAMAAHDSNNDPKVLMQATEFEPTDQTDAPASAVFVGNSRKVDRPIVRWAVEAGLDLAVFGGDWQGTAADQAVHGSSYPNERLPSLYGGADLVLNDHWDSMRDFGYISNRIFDVLASDGRVVSDDLPSIRRVFGDVVPLVSSARELQTVAAGESDDSVSERGRIAERIRADHSFDARARQLVNDIFEYLRFEPPFEPEVAPSTTTSDARRAVATDADAEQPRRVGALLMSTRLGFQSSAYVRVISPLTSEDVFNDVDLRVTSSVGDINFDGLDALIVQRTAVPDIAKAKELVSTARNHDVRVIVDIDDHFGRIRPGTDEFELYADRLPALDFLVAESDVVMVSTPTLAESYGLQNDERVRVVENGLDPRLWRRYERPDLREPRHPGKLRLLYMGTATHDEDFQMILPALDDFRSSRDFELTIIGAVRHLPDRPWISRLSPPPGSGVYPRFVQWFLRERRFDIGLAPLAETSFNAAKSDIKFLDYCAVGAVPVLSDSSAYSGDSHGDGLANHASSTTTSWLDALASASSEVDEGARIQQRESFVFESRSAAASGRKILEIVRSSDR